MKRKITISLGMVVLFFSLIFFYTKYSTMLNASHKTTMVKSSQVLPRATNFAQYNTLRSAELNKLNRKILGQNYIGAYIVSNRDNIVNSMGSGYASAAEKQAFNYNSTVRVGNLESIINAMLLMDTLKKSKISMDTKLNKYVPELDGKITVTANRLLNNELNISVNSNSLTGLDEKSALNKFFEILKTNKVQSDSQQVKANQILLAIVLMRINRSSYKALLTQFFQKNDLDGSRTIDSQSFSERTDAVSYHLSKTTDGAPQYDKPYKEIDTKYTFGTDQIRMSMIDILNTIRVMSSDNLSASYQKTLYQYGQKLEVLRKSNNHMYYTINSHGFRTYVMAGSGSKRIVISSENYPNTGVSKLHLAKSIYSSLFDD